ncbi:hypothetical protein H6P81_001054 [Aristolochia fimbriata]|uniref:Uncharacterized protein n=1 Tax=Aristolochia fimbriata TaxID=158543 RepID=A0AAV7F733_ARIFI|nr:hypothetical protein H6P81_001054 [Aristolochia fimbriata]
MSTDTWGSSSSAQERSHFLRFHPWKSSATARMPTQFPDSLEGSALTLPTRGWHFKISSTTKWKIFGRVLKKLRGAQEEAGTEPSLNPEVFPGFISEKRGFG